MIKQLEKLIGQPTVKAALNEIIVAKNYSQKRKEPFIFPPLFLSGLTGVGKTYFAEAFAKALSESEDGFRFEELPVKAGWRFFDKLSERVCSVDDKSGLGLAIPTVFLVDEAHEPSPIEEMVKLITGTKTPKLFERNGTKFYHDPALHSWIFASNEEIDPAQKRRCIEVPFGTYNRGEKKQLITAMCYKEVTAEALEYLESRSKPMAGDIENLCKRLNLQPIDKIGINEAKTVIKNIGLFPQGLLRKDLELLIRMGHDVRPTPVEALKAKIGDVKTTATRARLGWLQALELAEARKGGYSLTKSGVNYLKKLKELQSGDKSDKKLCVAVKR